MIRARLVTHESSLRVHCFGRVRRSTYSYLWWRHPAQRLADYVWLKHSNYAIVRCDSD